MGTIKAVIFDLDGVLADASDWHFQALARALSDHGFTLDREEHLRHCEGLPTMEKLKILSSAKGLPAKLHGPINELKQRYTIELIMRNCLPCEAHIEMLSRLRSENYRLAVASNAVRKTIELVLSRCGLSAYFEFYLSSQDVPEPKPSPLIYRAAFLKLKLEPCECLVLEDHPAGLKAARDSGARVVRVENIKDVCYAFISSQIRAAARERT